MNQVPQKYIIAEEVWFSQSAMRLIQRLEFMGRLDVATPAALDNVKGILEIYYNTLVDGHCIWDYTVATKNVDGDFVVLLSFQTREDGNWTDITHVKRKSIIEDLNGETNA